MNTRSPVIRSRNAVASKEALLNAARELFSDRGFEQTTVRDIGERAGIDAALIARYFGNKLNLYLATLTADSTDAATLTPIPDVATFVEGLIGRIERNGPGPLMQAIVRTDTTPQIRQVAREQLEQRLIAPLADLFARRGVPSPELRAEAAVGASIGILVIRWSGSLQHVQRAERGELVQLLTMIIEDLASP